jgi:hypothetical protein
LVFRNNILEARGNLYVWRHSKFEFSQQQNANPEDSKTQKVYLGRTINNRKTPYWQIYAFNESI